MKLVLQQRLEQKLLMTVELRQRLNYYNTIELEQFIREQELENPLIELKEKDLPIQYEERVQRTTNSSDSHDILMNTLKSQEVNMRDELFAQAKFMISDDDALTLLSTLIYNLNDNGYLTDLTRIQ